MKLFALTLSMVLTFLFGCQPKARPLANTVNSVQSPAGPTNATSDAPWSEVIEKTTCEALERTNCVGYYGMTINNQGVVTVGPDENGRSASAQLTADELTELSSRASTVAQGDLSAPACEDVASVPGSSDTIAITLRSRNVMKIYDRPGTPATVCYLGGKERVEALHDVIIKLMQKYYPQPFPAVVHEGLWGGSHIGVTVDNLGARVRLDCAQAISAQPWKANGNYEFQSQGQLFLNSDNGASAPKSVTFHGSVYGQIMTLNIKSLPGDGLPLDQTFTLTYGNHGTLRGCPGGN